VLATGVFCSSAHREPGFSPPSLVYSGHGWDVKCLDWHPVTSLLASGSKDNLVKLWDPKSGKNLTTMYARMHVYALVRR
jgi:WD40 repeat protein